MVSIRVSIVIRHKFHLRYACWSVGDPLVYGIPESPVVPSLFWDMLF